MKVEQRIWTSKKGWETKGGDLPEGKALVFAFGSREVMENESLINELLAFYPKGDVIMNSTSGEILGDSVYDDSLVVTAIHFEKTTYEVFSVDIKENAQSSACGEKIAAALAKDGLKHVLVISDGGLVNGSELSKSLNDHLPEGVTTTGGLAGDAARFEKTYVGWNGAPRQGQILGVGLYGEAIEVGYGSVGGWDPFGTRRKVTKSDGNVLYELDGKSALELYKLYLGDMAKELPGAALRFPLSLSTGEDEKSLVRTILSIDEESQSMTFAGDVPEGATVQLMKANFDKLIDGAYEAAESGYGTISKTGKKPELALLISCVGRKLVLDQRIDEEIESVLEIIGDDVPVSGFYSYGELAPFAGFSSCRLHNQTMTITLLGENV